MIEKTEHELVEMVNRAKSDPDYADILIRQYMPFIKSELSKQVYQEPASSHSDALSIALLAFYEAIIGYDSKRGAFLFFASQVIKSRLIDYHRKERKHREVISLDLSMSDDENVTLIERVADEKTDGDRLKRRALSEQEISEFARDLQSYGVTLSEVADNSPKQERTLRVCVSILEFAKQEPGIFDDLVRTKKLPIEKIVNGTKVSRKTIDRHRKYLVALLVAFTNGYEIIRGHLRRLNSGMGGER